MAQAGEHAIVIGGSMAGLLASRVLSDHYAKVTVIERDVLPTDAGNRRGVPQGRHSHALLSSGMEVLERLFTGILDELVRDGAVRADPVGDVRWFMEGGCLSKFDSGMTSLLMSRPFLESHVRRRAKDVQGVQFVEDSKVDGLATTNGRVTGVILKGETIVADMVVDCCGRGTHGPQWLEELGYGRPPEERVEVALAYATRLFGWKKTELGGDKGVILPPTPQGKRGAVLIAQERDRWTVTLIGHFGNVPPEDLKGFIEYAGTLPSRLVHDVISQAEPLGEAASIRYPASVRRRYEKMTRFPEGFLVFGDAICSFNPIYGQGMSSAALQSMALRGVLEQGREGIARQFFTKASKVIDNPWAIAAGSDLRMPEASGPRSAGLKLVNWYMGRLHRAAHRDHELTRAFIQVAQLLAPPPSVMHPRLVWRVLLGGVG